MNGQLKRAVYAYIVDPDVEYRYMLCRPRMLHLGVGASCVSCNTLESSS